MTILKLFEFAQSDFIVATNLRQAIRCWVSYSDATIRDALDDFREVPKSEWRKLKFSYDEEMTRKCSFEERIIEVIKTGEEKVPFFLATSEW